MPDHNIRFGLTLPNRGVIIGATTVEEMFVLAQKADAEASWDSVWVGDSLFSKPRLDALVLLATAGEGPFEVQLAVGEMNRTRAFFTQRGLPFTSAPTDLSALLLWPDQTVGARLVLAEQPNSNKKDAGGRL